MSLAGIQEGLVLALFLGRPTSSDNYGEPSCFLVLFPTLVLDFSQDGYTPLLRYYFSFVNQLNP